MEQPLFAGYIDDLIGAVPITLAAASLRIFFHLLHLKGYVADVPKFTGHVPGWPLSEEGRLWFGRQLGDKLSAGLTLVGSPQTGFRYSIGEKLYMKEQIEG